MRHLTTALITSTLIGFSMQSALAVEPQEFMERFTKLSADMGTIITFGAIDGTNARFTVSDVTLEISQDGKTTSLPLGSLTVEDIKEAGDETFSAAMIKVADVKQTAQDTAFTMTGIAMTGVELPKDAATGYLFYEKFMIENANFSTAGNQIFEMQNLVMDVEGNDDRTIITGNMDIDAINIDMSSIRNPNSRAILEELGYLTLKGTSGMKMNWDANSGLLSTKDFFIDFENAGRLSMDVEVDGYTLDVARSFGEINQAKSQQAAGMAMMGLLQQMTYISSSITFEDDSLTGKILDFQAAKQGTDRKSLVGLAKAVLPFAMSQLNKPEFTQKVAVEIGAFLENPKSLEVTATPSEPVPALDLVTAGGANPANLIDMLNVQVTANK